MNKLVFVFQKLKNSSGPKILRAIFGCGVLSKVFVQRRKFWQVFPANCPTIIRTRKPHYCYYYFYRASNCPHKIFSSSCAVFLGFYNVSISCHLTVKACQIISDLLAVRLNELETSIIYSS